jgi:hypothetical protein
MLCTYASVGIAVIHFANNTKLRPFQIHGANIQWNSDFTASFYSTLYMNGTEGLSVEFIPRDAMH